MGSARSIAVPAPLDEFDLVQGAENLTLYQFNTGTAKHYFCKTCGIHTHHQRRSNPDQLGINVASPGSARSISPKSR